MVGEARQQRSQAMARAITALEHHNVDLEKFSKKFGIEVDEVAGLMVDQAEAAGVSVEAYVQSCVEECRQNEEDVFILEI